MRRTLETLLTAARIEDRAGRVTGDAAAAAHAAAAGSDAIVADRGISVRVDPAPAIRIGVETDVAERVLSPLIENACRYGAANVRIGVEQRNGAVVFLVEHDGPGVPEQDRERIFEPGWRNGASGGARDDQGAGLGLQLARRLARATGGDVCIEPGGRGGRFAARLPLG